MTIKIIDILNKKNFTNEQQPRTILFDLNDSIIENSHVKSKDFINLLLQIDRIDDKKEFKDIYERIIYRIDDTIQLNTLYRIKEIKDKQLNKIKDICIDNNQDYNTVTYKKIFKFCPHCNKKVFAKTNTKYIICGYENENNNGFDWIGCGQDWCFQCNKKLCKSWDVDQLYNIHNRNHNIKCCKKHAIKTLDNYYENYCFCNNKHVNRNKY